MLWADSTGLRGGYYAGAAIAPSPDMFADCSLSGTRIL